MLYRKYLILMVLSLCFSQSLFNRLLPEEHYLGDARSLGIGGSYLTTSRSSILILSNPARIANISKGLSVHSSLNRLSESQRMIIKDNWGGFLAEQNFVFNQNSYLKHSLGYIFNSNNPIFYEKPMSKKYKHKYFLFGMGLLYSRFNSCLEHEILTVVIYYG